MDLQIYFENRSEAGRQLAVALKKYRKKDVIVYGLPRGGVVTAYEVAKYLNAPLNIVVVRKIGHPYFPEYAIGAVAANGHYLFNKNEIEKIDQFWLKQKVEAERIECGRRKNMYLPRAKSLSKKAGIAILVDDGAATGLTLQVGIMELNHRHPQKIVVAVPVAPCETVKQIKKQVDEFISLVSPVDYKGSVGAYYRNFPQVSEEEVIRLLDISTDKNWN